MLGKSERTSEKQRRAVIGCERFDNRQTGSPCFERINQILVVFPRFRGLASRLLQQIGPVVTMKHRGRNRNRRRHTVSFDDMLAKSFENVLRVKPIRFNGGQVTVNFGELLQWEQNDPATGFRGDCEL